MINPESSLEKSLRKHPYLAGTWVLLGNGEKWCISSCPLGRRGEIVLSQMQKIDEARAEVANLEDVAGSQKMMQVTFEFCLFVLQLNYPKLTQEIAEENELFQIAHGPLVVQILQGNFEIGTTIGSKLGEG